jgi:hypothetical protein
MPDRSEDLRIQAARCREAAERSTDPNSRDELIRLSHTFLELANSTKADFAPVMAAVTDMMKEASEPPKKEEAPRWAASSQPLGQMLRPASHLRAAGRECVAKPRPAGIIGACRCNRRSAGCRSDKDN